MNENVKTPKMGDEAKLEETILKPFQHERRYNTGSYRGMNDVSE